MFNILWLKIVYIFFKKQIRKQMYRQLFKETEAAGVTCCFVIPKDTVPFFL